MTQNSPLPKQSPQIDIEDAENKSKDSSGKKSQGSGIKKQPNSIVNLIGELENFDALVAIFVDGQCLERNEIIIKVVIQELQVDIIQNV